MDYLIKNGRIADKNGCYEADLIIKNGKITYIGDGLDATGLEVIDAAGCYVLPGFIDTHTHFDLDTGSAVTADNFDTGTARQYWAAQQAYLISPRRSGTARLAKRLPNGNGKLKLRTAITVSIWQ